MLPASFYRKRAFHSFFSLQCNGVFAVSPLPLVKAGGHYRNHLTTPPEILLLTGGFEAPFFCQGRASHNLPTSVRVVTVPLFFFLPRLPCDLDRRQRSLFLSDGHRKVYFFEKRRPRQTPPSSCLFCNQRYHGFEFSSGERSLLSSG